MGELIICTHPVASMPYYLEDSSINLYSMEELCYCIEKDTCLLEKDLMNDEFCAWLQDEFQEQKLAAALRKMIARKEPFAAFAAAIFKCCDYFTEEKAEAVLDTIRQMEQMTPFERGKVRADRLLASGRNERAMREYGTLLSMREACENNPEAEGNIRHNLGVLYAWDFLYEEAAESFESAYQKNGSTESLKSCMQAYLLANDTGNSERIKTQYGVTQGMLDTLAEEREKIITDVDDKPLQKIRDEYKMHWCEKSI